MAGVIINSSGNSAEVKVIYNWARFPGDEVLPGLKRRNRTLFKEDGTGVTVGREYGLSKVTDESRPSSERSK